MLEARLAQYSVVARMVPSLKRALRGLRYEPMNPRWEIAEFEHRPHGCLTRGVALWRGVDPRERSGAEPVYDGTLCVSSLAHGPAADTGRSLVLLRWPRRNGATHPRNSCGLCAHEDSDASFCGQCSVSGSDSARYNLVTAFQRTCLPEESQSLTLSKLRQRLFWLPGQLTRPENRPTLRLANSRLSKTGEIRYCIESTR